MTRLEKNVDRSFPVGAGGRLSVTANTARVRVVGVDGSDRVEVAVSCVVEADDETQARELMEKIRVDFDHAGDHVRLAAHAPRSRRRWFWHWRGWLPHLTTVSSSELERAQLYVEIRCPRRFDLALDTRAGELKVSDLVGKIRAEATAGSIEIGDVVGEVVVSTRAGAIRVGRVEGPVEARSVAGSIRIDGATDGIRAESQAGAITACLSRQPARGSRLATVVGNVTVGLAEGVGVDMEAATRGGRLRVDVPVTTRGEPAHRSLRGTINGGGPKLVLSAMAGNVHLKRAS